LIPGPHVIRHLGQLSLPSLRGWQIEYQPSPAGVKAGCAHLCRAESKIVSTILRWHPVVLRWLADEELTWL